MFHNFEFLVAYCWVTTLNHGGYEVSVLAVYLASLHWSAADEYSRDVKAHGSHEHTRSNLVAVRYAHHGVSLVGVDHVLYRVGNDVA